MSELFVISGCNGSGKTTFAQTILPNLSVMEFVNADLIAAELNPDDPDAVAIQAGRLMLKRLQNLSEQGIDFAFETTLAARSFAPFLRNCQTKGYRVNLVYVWLPSVELAVSRVARRVASGGHNIPEAVIRRRYERGRKNFLKLYRFLVDYWIVYDNSRPQKTKVAEKVIGQPEIIYQLKTWQSIIQEDL